MLVSNNCTAAQTQRMNTTAPNFAGGKVLQTTSQLPNYQGRVHIPERFVDAFENSAEMKKAGKVYDRVLASFWLRDTGRTPIIQLSITKKPSLWQKVKNALAPFPERPREYVYRYKNNDSNFERFQSLKKEDIDARIKRDDEQEAELLKALEEFDAKKAQRK